MKDLTKRRIICNNCGESYSTYEEEVVNIRCPSCRSDLFIVQDETFNYVVHCFKRYLEYNISLLFCPYRMKVKWMSQEEVKKMYSKKGIS